MHAITQNAMHYERIRYHPTLCTHNIILQVEEEQKVFRVLDERMDTKTLLLKNDFFLLCIAAVAVRIIYDTGRLFGALP